MSRGGHRFGSSLNPKTDQTDGLQVQTLLGVFY